MLLVLLLLLVLAQQWSVSMWFRLVRRMPLLLEKMLRWVRWN
jgi:hypothetical protein